MSVAAHSYTTIQMTQNQKLDTVLRLIRYYSTLLSSPSGHFGHAHTHPSMSRAIARNNIEVLCKARCLNIETVLNHPGVVWNFQELSLNQSVATTQTVYDYPDFPWHLPALCNNSAVDVGYIINRFKGVATDLVYVAQLSKKGEC